jgi:predicted ATPase
MEFMRVDRIEIAGYRSLRSLRLPLGQATVVVGRNGTGKTNLYQALRLVVESARGRFAQTVAEEGGMPSLLWAGSRKKGPVSVELTLQMESWVYALSFGLPPPTHGLPQSEQSPFSMDPWIKSETLRVTPDDGRPVTMMERKGPSAMVRDADGRPAQVPFKLSHAESAMSQIRDPMRYPELERLRAQLDSWRFYHAFETHAQSPIRQPQIGVTTPVLSADGHDLAAALATIRHVGNPAALGDAIDRAFPGARLVLDSDDRGRINVGMEMPGVGRPLEASELSDGTLRYLCLLAALLTPRPPALIALNEPETSLHEGLLDPLAELIAQAARNGQVWVTTHADLLAQAIASRVESRTVRLEMVSGETRIQDQGLLD